MPSCQRVKGTVALSTGRCLKPQDTKFCIKSHESLYMIQSITLTC
jgi:hypothetical protein